MPTSSKNSKNPKSSKTSKSKSYFSRFKSSFEVKWRSLFGQRGVHKTFKLTDKRDSTQAIVIPGYIQFSLEVLGLIIKNKKNLIWLSVVYIVTYMVLVGVGSQENYASLGDVFKESATNAFDGSVDAFLQAGMLFTAIASSGLNDAMNSSQQIFAVMLFVMMWLTIVWLIRNYIAGKKVKMRDGLYSSGSPIFASLVIIFVMVLQLIPVALAAVGYVAASSTGMLNGGVEAMLFWLAAGLLAVLSLYWLVSSFFALIVVTVPGTYPLAAIHVANRLVSGRRLKILLRILWMCLTVSMTWLAVLMTFILIDMGVKNLIPAIEWLPIVPFVLLILGAWTIVWSCVYIYALYRKVVDSEISK